EGECHLLFQKRAPHIQQGGEICFPGGRYDPRQDTSSEETALRETVEELGIAREHIRILGRSETVFSHQGLAIDPFVGVLEIADLDELCIDPNEVAQVFLLPMTYFEQNAPAEYQVRVEVQPSYIDEHGEEHILLPAKDLGLPARYAKPWGGRRHRVLVYPTPGVPIWGLTAGMIYNLVQKLQAAS
ncbi:NUDIX domain-containing protein, partial [candidate division KSB3 bacterium]|nr:NUDIX domain-containing protein [candidate division KSB3 bacterium]MBD3324753.1 NUDIX domain-containing protein [candidate division KSB3 bacterium]